MLFLLLLQVEVCPYLKVFGGMPNLVLLWVVGWGLTHRRRGMLWAAVGGVGMDLLSGIPFGVHTLGMILAAVLAERFREGALEANLLMPLGMAFVASVIHDAIAAGALYATGWQADLVDLLFGVVLPSAVYNVVLMPLFFVTLRASARRLREEEWLR